MKKTVIITRGVSGSGKSTVAEAFCDNRSSWITCCADDYFMVDGVYNFDPINLGKAHVSCQDKFLLALKDPEIEGIVVANTNTKNSDWSFYKKEAERAGAMVISLVIENHHGNRDIHSVPAATLDRQAENIINSLKLR